MILEKPILITKNIKEYIIKLDYKRLIRKGKTITQRTTIIKDGSRRIILVTRAINEKKTKIIQAAISISKKRFKITGIITFVKDKDIVKILKAKFKSSQIIKYPKISIIIPTLNEEKDLPNLLKSIKQQNYPCEIIISDANSKDSTREIAKEHNCKITEGGRPAKGRNNGVEESKHNLIVFLDADTILKKDFLKGNIKEFLKRDLDMAICYMKFSKATPSIKITEKFYNISFRIISKIYGIGTGFCIICKKDMHKKIKGFDESIHILEDMDYVRRAKLSGARYGILKSHYVIISPRRHEKEGPFKLTAKYSYAFFRGLIKGPMREEKVEYEWAKYD